MGELVPLSSARARYSLVVGGKTTSTPSYEPYCVAAAAFGPMHGFLPSLRHSWASISQRAKNGTARLFVSTGKSNILTFLSFLPVPQQQRKKNTHTQCPVYYAKEACSISPTTVAKNPVAHTRTNVCGEMRINTPVPKLITDNLKTQAALSFSFIRMMSYRGDCDMVGTQIVTCVAPLPPSLPLPYCSLVFFLSYLDVFALRLLKQPAMSFLVLALGK